MASGSRQALSRLVLHETHCGQPSWVTWTDLKDGTELTCRMDNPHLYATVHIYSALGRGTPAYRSVGHGQAESQNS